MILFLRQMGRIARLAVPVGISRAGAFLLIIADTIMVGREDIDQLAFMAMANAMVLILFMTGIGMQIGTAVLTSQAIGAGRRGNLDAGILGQIWTASIIFGLCLGVIAIVACLPGAWLFRLIGQSPEMSAGAGPVLLLASLGVPGGLIFVGCTMFLEAMKRPLAGLVAMALAIICNIALNWLWIFSDYAWGDAGEAAAVATSLARWLAAVILLLYTLHQRRKLGLILPSALVGVMLIFGKLRRWAMPWAWLKGLRALLLPAWYSSPVIWAPVKPPPSPSS